MRAYGVGILKDVRMGPAKAISTVLLVDGVDETHKATDVLEAVV